MQTDFAARRSGRFQRAVFACTLVIAISAACSTPPRSAAVITVPPAPTSSPSTSLPPHSTTETPVPPSTTAPSTSSTTTALTGDAETATVITVLDGDTFDVFMGGRPYRVRLVGINAPESGECYADQATRALADLISDRTVVLSMDRSETDQYERLLRYVRVDGSLINLELVATGAAWAVCYPPDCRLDLMLEEAERTAQNAELGLWAAEACGPAEPLGDAMSFSAMQCDAPGSDNDNLNAEWVELTNMGSKPIDLSGWMVRDGSSSNRYRFPDGFEIAPGAPVRLYTGAGTDTPDSLYWGNTGSAVWNNDGDTAYLIDPAGNVTTLRECLP